MRSGSAKFRLKQFSQMLRTEKDVMAVSKHIIVKMPTLDQSVMVCTLLSVEQFLRNARLNLKLITVAKAQQEV